MERKILSYFLHGSLSSGSTLSSLYFDQSLYNWACKRPLKFDKAQEKFKYNPNPCFVWGLTEFILIPIIILALMQFIFSENFHSQEATRILFTSLLYAAAGTFILTGLGVSIGEISFGADIPPAFSRMLDFEKDLRSGMYAT